MEIARGKGSEEKVPSFSEGGKVRGKVPAEGKVPSFYEGALLERFHPFLRTFLNNTIILLEWRFAIERR